MVDIGGGEGRFTCEMLNEIGTVPRSIHVVEPSDENVEEYCKRITTQFPSIQAVEPCRGGIEAFVDKLPTGPVYLASHSLYRVCDHDERGRSEIVRKLVQKGSAGQLLIVMASRQSQAYTVKHMVRTGVLKRGDPSTFGEDIRELIPKGYRVSWEIRDSFMDLRVPLRDGELMIAWLSYFCRIDALHLRPHIATLRKILIDATILKRQLPQMVQSWIEGVSTRAGRTTDDATPILFHKEVVIRVSSAN